MKETTETLGDRAGSVVATLFAFSLRNFLQRYGLYVFLVLLIIVSAIVSPAFLTGQNIQNILKQTGPLGIVAVGQTFVVLTGGFDLSVASLMGTVAVLATVLGHNTDSKVVPIFLIAIVCGVMVGGANGYLVTKRRVSPFLATLAMMILLQGFRFVYTGGAPSGNLPPFIQTLGNGNLLGVPVNIVFLAILTAIAATLLYRTSYGRKLYIVGGNPRAAYLAGINSDMIIIMGYVICAVLAAFAGLALVGYVGSVDNWVGKGYELQSIAAVVMGGGSFRGGEGGIYGTLAGVLVLVLIVNLVLLLGLPVEIQYVAEGAVIIVASALNLSRRRSS
jgi:ribose/xylose/arabinose/galactoside ABC-type transport system permease subunit